MLSWPWGTTDAPLAMAKICRPNAAWTGSPPTCEKSTGRLFAPLAGKLTPAAIRSKSIVFSRLRQVHPAVESLERLLELDVLDPVVVDVPADRVELLEPVVDDGPDVVPEEPPRPEALDQDDRGQRFQGLAGELAAGGSIPIPAT